VDMPVADANRLLGKARAVAAAQGPCSEVNKRDLESSSLDQLHGNLLLVAIVRKTAQIKRPPSGFARLASCDHRIRHGPFKIVIEKLATLVARGDPGSLHLAHLTDLLVLEFCAQPAKTVVEDTIPDEPLARVTGHDLGWRHRHLVLDAGLGYDADTIFPSPMPAGLGFDAFLHRCSIAGIRLVVLRPGGHGRQKAKGQSCDAAPPHGVSHFGACGGLTTRILVALSFLSSAISESESLKSNTSMFCFRWSGVAVRGIEQTPICTR